MHAIILLYIKYSDDWMNCLQNADYYSGGTVLHKSHKDHYSIVRHYMRHQFQKIIVEPAYTIVTSTAKDNIVIELGVKIYRSLLMN